MTPLQPTLAPHHWQKRAGRRSPYPKPLLGAINCAGVAHFLCITGGRPRELSVNLQENGFLSRGQRGKTGWRRKGTCEQGLSRGEERDLHLIGVRHLDAVAMEEVRTLVPELSVSLPLPSPPCRDPPQADLSGFHLCSSCPHSPTHPSKCEFQEDRDSAHLPCGIPSAWHPGSTHR